MKRILMIVLLFTVNSAMALGEAIEQYRENQAEQTGQSQSEQIPTSNPTVIYGSPDSQQGNAARDSALYKGYRDNNDGTHRSPQNTQKQEIQSNPGSGF